MSKARYLLPLCLSAFFLFSVAFPVASMLGRMASGGMARLLASPQFQEAAASSVSTALAATAISIALSLLAAWCLERTEMRWKAAFGILFLLPMLIPSISHAFGLVTLLGANGLLARALGWEGGIYGFWGIVAGSVMYAFPVSFLMIASVLRYEDGLVHEAARALGVPFLHRLKDITFPHIRATLVSACFLVFAMVVTDYGVPLMIGGKETTLSVLMYQKAVAMIDYGTGSAIGACLLLPAIAAFFVDLRRSGRGTGNFVAVPVPLERSKARDVLALLLCAAIALAILAPLASFAAIVFETKYPVDTAFTLYHAERAIHRGAGLYLLHSIAASLAAAALGTALAFLCAYLHARTRIALRRWIHLLALAPMAIPGIVLGLSYVIFFHGAPIYGTLLILVLANAIHFFASPYLMMCRSLEKLNPHLEAVGACLGVGRLYIVRDVVLPGVRHTLRGMFLYFFVNSMMTISAVSFLSPPAPRLLALMINQFEAQRLMESAAFVSLLILAANLAALLLLRRRGKG